MLSEEFVSAICGPPLSSNTAVAKHNGLYTHTLSPAYGVKSTLKNSSAPVQCVALSETHVYAAQHEKAYVHVYSRIRGNQEAFVPFPERIRCVTLAGDVLVLGTAEGRLMLWEICTGRLISTPPRHVQAVSCVASTPYHILTGSDDSDVHVWSLPQLLELGSTAEHEPERSLSHHRAGITALATSQGVNPDTSFCVSASKDKSCIVWNFHTGDALRTLLFPSFPLCIALDPASRALFVSSDDGSLYLAEFFGSKPLLGPNAEDPATVVQVTASFGAVPPDAGPASCLSVSYDGTVLLTGHPKGQIMRWDVADHKTPVELANLNAAVTNLIFVPPVKASATTKALQVVKPSQAERNYTFTAQFEADLGPDSTSMFDASVGFPQDMLERAVLSLQQPVTAAGGGAAQTASGQELQQQNDELWEIVHQQRALQKQMYQRVLESGRSS